MRWTDPPPGPGRRPTARLLPPSRTGPRSSAPRSRARRAASSTARSAAAEVSVPTTIVLIVGLLRSSGRRYAGGPRPDDGACMRSSCWCQHTPERGVPARGTAGRPPWTARPGGGTDARVMDGAARPRRDSPGSLAGLIASRSWPRGLVFLMLGLGRRRSPRRAFGSAGAGCSSSIGFAVGGCADRVAGPVEPDRLVCCWRPVRDGGPGARPAVRASTASLDSPGVGPRRRRRRVDHRVDLDPVHGVGRALDPAVLPGRHLPSRRWRLARGRGRDPRRRSARSASRSRPDRPRRVPRATEPVRDRGCRRGSGRSADVVMLVFLVGAPRHASPRWSCAYRRSRGRRATAVEVAGPLDRALGVAFLDRRAVLDPDGDRGASLDLVENLVVLSGSPGSRWRSGSRS